MIFKRRKKAQGAIEFLLILAFVFTIIAIIMYFTGEQLIDISAKEQDKLAENFAEKIDNELQILSRVEPGYRRELILYTQNYNISIIKSYVDSRPTTLKLDDLYNNNKTYYFDLTGNYNLDTGNLLINLSERFDTEFNINVTVLTFEKIYSEEIKGLDLS